ncbi:hypothetical protein OCS65_19405 [Rhodococcus aetherivorans]|uniref:Uncharacterized protein n=1 Tax=Rhodococcus aetherivorans TaxID=191292 RepID=A0AA46S9K2_9NOCA|nr:hypothetical protein [Rhodococcus aetherivorans]UYF92628.1 hypothetical protein OCS65_19405 [Rhodococcus aetherivorans]
MPGLGDIAAGNRGDGAGEDVSLVLRRIVGVSAKRLELSAGIDT